MAITPNQHHNTHDVQIHLTSPGATKHWAALRCLECNKHIQWLNQSDTQQLIDMGIAVSTKMYVPKKQLKENHGV